MHHQDRHSPRTLRRVMRPAPALSPEDSIGRFVQMLRSFGADGLPIQRDGKLCGVIWQEDILPILASHDEQDREEALRLPLARAMRPAETLARPDMTPDEVGALMAERSIGVVPVVDSEDYCLGVVLAVDLLVPDVPLPMPQRVGSTTEPSGRAQLPPQTGGAGVVPPATSAAHPGPQ